mmetsp:Transcript_27743/g.47179  ORF Transcript_27743/g.47179 Transcript_27743/m.47179 type:complete len:189 (-) Transcript_27743:128-694(-)
MNLKVFLSIAAIAGASAADLRRNLRANEEARRLQKSISCLIRGNDFMDCCPSALASDGVCTLAWCVDGDDMEIRDACDCLQIERACRQLAFYSFLVPGLEGTCDVVDECCVPSETSNDGFNTCMETTIKEGNVQTPDIESLMPNGLPDFDSSESTESSVDVAAIIESPETVEDEFVGGDEDMSMDFRF